MSQQTRNKKQETPVEVKPHNSYPYTIFINGEILKGQVPVLPELTDRSLKAKILIDPRISENAGRGCLCHIPGNLQSAKAKKLQEDGVLYAYVYLKKDLIPSNQLKSVILSLSKGKRKEAAK